MAMETNKNERRETVAETPRSPRRSVIAVGKKVGGRWQVRTSLWRYLATTALSRQ
jgi:hypothetical protein